LLLKQKKRFDDQGFVRAADDTAKLLKQRTPQPSQQPSAKVEEYLREFEGEIDEACWKGYHKEGMKTMFGKEYPNCVKNKKANEELQNESPVKEASKDNESSVTVRNPVAKNAMAGIGGGGMGKHKDKKQADKRGEVKHKKDKVPMDLEEGSLDRIKKLSGL
jgi:hypothetical protein